MNIFRSVFVTYLLCKLNPFFGCVKGSPGDNENENKPELIDLYLDNLDPSHFNLIQSELTDAVQITPVDNKIIKSIYVYNENIWDKRETTHCKWLTIFFNKDDKFMIILNTIDNKEKSVHHITFTDRSRYLGIVSALYSLNPKLITENISRRDKLDIADDFDKFYYHYFYRENADLSYEIYQPIRNDKFILVTEKSDSIWDHNTESSPEVGCTRVELFIKDRIFRYIRVTLDNGYIRQYKYDNDNFLWRLIVQQEFYETYNSLMFKQLDYLPRSDSTGSLYSDKDKQNDVSNGGKKYVTMEIDIAKKSDRFNYGRRNINGDHFVLFNEKYREPAKLIKYNDQIIFQGKMRMFTITMVKTKLDVRLIQIVYTSETEKKPALYFIQSKEEGIWVKMDQEDFFDIIQDTVGKSVALGFDSVDLYGLKAGIQIDDFPPSIKEKIKKYVEPLKIVIRLPTTNMTPPSSSKSKELSSDKPDMEQTVAKIPSTTIGVVPEPTTVTTEETSPTIPVPDPTFDSTSPGITVAEPKTETPPSSDNNPQLSVEKDSELSRESFKTSKEENSVIMGDVEEEEEGVPPENYTVESVSLMNKPIEPSNESIPQETIDLLTDKSKFTTGETNKVISEPTNVPKSLSVSSDGSTVINNTDNSVSVPVTTTDSKPQTQEDQSEELHPSQEEIDRESSPLYVKPGDIIVVGPKSHSYIQSPEDKLNNEAVGEQNKPVTTEVQSGLPENLTEAEPDKGTGESLNIPVIEEPKPTHSVSPSTPSQPSEAEPVNEETTQQEQGQGHTQEGVKIPEQEPSSSDVKPESKPEIHSSIHSDKSLPQSNTDGAVKPEGIPTTPDSTPKPSVPTTEDTSKPLPTPSEPTYAEPLTTKPEEQGNVVQHPEENVPLRPSNAPLKQKDVTDKPTREQSGKEKKRTGSKKPVVTKTVTVKQKHEETNPNLHKPSSPKPTKTPTKIPVKPTNVPQSKVPSTKPVETKIPENVKPESPKQSIPSNADNSTDTSAGQVESKTTPDLCTDNHFESLDIGIPLPDEEEEPEDEECLRKRDGFITNSSLFALVTIFAYAFY